MSDTDFALPQLDGLPGGFPGSLPDGMAGLGAGTRDAPPPKAPGDLEQLFDVPVLVSAVLGHARMPLADLLRIGPGSLIELDRRVGEAIDILVNNRLVARGEVVLVDERLGVTMTEIVRADH